MNRLDELLRDGLREATEPVGVVPPGELARLLAARRAAPQEIDGRTRRRRGGGLAAAAVLVALVGGLVLALRDRPDAEQVVVQEPTTSTTTVDTTPPVVPAPEELQPLPPVAPLPAPLAAIEDWAPGWYQLDTSSLPQVSGRSVWFDGELYVTASGAGAELDTTRVFRRDRDTAAWVELPPLDLTLAALVAAGDHLVAVGEEGFATTPIPRAWAVLAPDGRSWRQMGRVRQEPTLASGRYLGPWLVWTGERVLDTTGAAVLDPATGSAAALEVPDEETLVLRTGPTVWTGERAVLATWGPEPGWSWDARGRFLGEVPPAAVDGLPEPPELSQPVRAAVAAVDGAVLAVGAPTWSEFALGRTLSEGQLRWDDAPAPPMAPFVGSLNYFVQCSPWLGAARDTALALTCNAAGSRAATSRGGDWALAAVPELLSTSGIQSVDSSEHAVTIMTSGPDMILVWVPSG